MMENKMRIALVGYLGNGGADRQIVMLSNELANKGHDVSLIVLAVNRNNYEISKKVKIINILDGEKRNILTLIKRFIKLKKTLVEIHPDVTISYWLQPIYMMAMMQKRITGKIIYSERGDPADTEYSGLMGLVRSVSFSKVDGFVFQTEEAKSYFDEKIQRKSAVIANSVSIPDGQFCTPAICREKRIVNVGRLHSQKNQRLLIEAFSLIAAEFPDYTLEVYGVGPMQDELESYIDEKALQGRIVLMGRKKNIFDYIYSASLFVLSSDFEGMPNALMEAMAIGLPCISTDYKPGGARDLIDNEVDGIIVPINDVIALSEAMKELLLNHSKAEQLAKNAQQIRVRNSNDRIFGQWESYIFRVMNF